MQSSDPVTIQPSWARSLVVGAHPDDEILGCGGTLARLRAQGAEIHALILGAVTTSRDDGPPADGRETDEAAKVMDFTSLTRCGFADNRFDEEPLLKLIKEIETVKQRIEPDVVFCHDPIDLNVDHRQVHQAVLTAFRPIGRSAEALITFETLSSTEYQDSALGCFAPNFYVDISAHIERKLRALECYRSELREFPHPRSLEGVRCLARKRGMESGCPYAEALRVVRWVV